jgi:hypothetical protein
MDSDSFRTLPAANDRQPESGEVLLNDSSRMDVDGTEVRVKGVRVDALWQIDYFVVDAPEIGDLMLPASLVTAAPSGGLVAALKRLELGGLPMFRKDREIETEVWEVLYADKRIPDRDLKGINLSVVDSVVYLQGHVRFPTEIRSIERAIYEIEGVLDIENRIASDRTLELEASAAVAGELRRIPVDMAFHSTLGNLTIEGHVQSEAARSRILERVRAIEGVVAVFDRIEVMPAGETEDNDQGSDDDGDSAGTTFGGDD